MDYSKYFDLDLDDAKQYIVDHTDFFGDKKASELNIKEVSDGNINHVYRVDDGKKSLILKQTGKTIRTSGNPLDQHRGHIEDRALEIQRKLSGGQVPEVYDYNETMHVILMENVADFKNLRYELKKEKIFPEFADQISSFMTNVLLPTTDLVMDRIEKKKMVKDFVNVGPCDITEKLVLTEPYYNYLGRNVFDDKILPFVKQNLYKNSSLKVEVGKLRNNFMNNAQAFLHGDLHSGSIFINQSDIRVFDSEFAFYGPMGYDIGNVIGNLIFPYVVQKGYLNKEGKGNKEFIVWLQKTIAQVFDMTFNKMAKKYDEIVKFPFYKERGFKNSYLRNVENDTLGYAGTEIIRRTVGDSKVLEITDIEDQNLQNLVMEIFVKIGSNLIMNRSVYNNGEEIVADIDQIFDEMIAK
ncbi:S-methyl-5-thioribose kinase [Lactobacillus intestinalis]|uniref:S-methyl-5-thioribose kinase n=1 Tax=Lactobacillus intestinalis TaxID=151781 RepID=UPI001F5997EE|nr:S-methyl-5-thioribose kinase [Lactobacillus intestinalis]